MKRPGAPPQKRGLPTRIRRSVATMYMSGGACGKPEARAASNQTSNARKRIRPEPSANVDLALVPAAPRKLACADASTFSPGSSSICASPDTSDAFEHRARPEPAAAAHRHEPVLAVD